VAAALATLFTVLAGPAVAGPAASTPASQITLAASEHAQAAQLDNIVVSYAGPAMNRKGCGDTIGSTFIIAWTPDRDFCEDAEITPAYLMCGSGKVTDKCPFNQASLNKRYLGRPIEAIVFYNEGHCLATAPDRAAVIGNCPNAAGSSGSNGTLYVWSASGYLVSRYWTNAYHNGYPWWLCNDGGGTGGTHVLDTGSLYDYGSNCQWNNAGIPGTIARGRPLARPGG
jgi:hypothetical protein